MKYLWHLLLLLQVFLAKGQEVDSLLFFQLNAQLKKPGDSLIIGYFTWENCSWGSSWLDFDENEQKSNALVKFLETNPSLKIEIGKHTDCRGRDEYNLLYSQRIAEQAKDVLVKKGIDETRIRAKGYGETQPIVKCAKCEKCQEEVHRKNSRFVVRVLE